MKSTRMVSISTGIILIFSFPSYCNSADLDPFSAQQVCMATISTVMGKNPSIMNIDKVKGAVTYVSYIRPSDGKRWAYRCKLDGSKAIWASETGRWRTNAADSKITFSISDSNLNILEKYGDGSSTKKNPLLCSSSEAKC